MKDTYNEPMTAEEHRAMLIREDARRQAATLRQMKEEEDAYFAQFENIKPSELRYFYPDVVQAYPFLDPSRKRLQDRGYPVR